MGRQWQVKSKSALPEARRLTAHSNGSKGSNGSTGKRGAAARRAAKVVSVAHEPVEPASSGSPEDILLGEYARTRDTTLRDKIVEACTPLVRRIVSDFIYSGVPTDDLMQVGFIGLLNAIEVFDPHRGVKFATYASHLVRGEIRHYLRDHRDTIRKPRWLQGLNQQIDQAVGKHLSQQGRFPTMEELASELNVVQGGLVELLKTREVLRTISLEADEETGELRVDRDRIRHKSYVSFQLPIEDKIMLFEAMEKLNTLQKRVLYYLFFTDLTQMEAARRIGISQKHVSRVLASSLNKLRGLLTPAT